MRVIGPFATRLGRDIESTTIDSFQGDAVYDKSRLIELIRQNALEFGEFTLASGKTANFYLDCRRLTLDSRGARLVAEGMLEELPEPWPDAVGGMAIGADPISAAIITMADVAGKSLKGFIVRKESKQHGKGRMVEGPIEPANRVVIVEDVVTTGGSSLRAIDHCLEFGLEVIGVLAIIDRLEGGKEAFAERGFELRTLLTIEDLGIAAPT